MDIEIFILASMAVNVFFMGLVISSIYYYFTCLLFEKRTSNAIHTEIAELVFYFLLSVYVPNELLIMYYSSTFFAVLFVCTCVKLGFLLLSILLKITFYCCYE